MECVNIQLTRVESGRIGDILRRRANEIASFSMDYQKKPDHYGSVELAMTREMQRLRRLADRVNPSPQSDEDD